MDAVIDGAVQRSGDHVRIFAQLIQAPSDKHLWARSYDRDFRDILALQSEVAIGDRPGNSDKADPRREIAPRQRPRRQSHRA